MKIIHDVPRPFGDEVVAGCDMTTFFHTYEWATTIAASLNNLTVATKGFILDDGKRAILPLVATKRRRRDSLKACWSMFPMVYGGPIAERELQPREVARITLSAIHPLFRAAFIVDNPFSQHHLPRAYQCEPMFTQVLDLEPGFDKIWRQFDKGNKSSTKRAMRLGVRVEVAGSLDDFRAYYAVYQDTLQRWGDKATSVYPWRLFESFFHLHSPQVRLWLARSQRDIIAGALVFYAKHHVVWWHGASLARHFDLCPNNLLQTEIIRDACDRGYAYYDFNPSGGHEGVVHFKQSFSPRRIDFFCFSWHNRLYEFYRRIKQSRRSQFDGQR